MPGYTLLRRPRSGRFCAFCGPRLRRLQFPPFAVPAVCSSRRLRFRRR